MAVVARVRSAGGVVGALTDKIRHQVLLEGALDGSNRVFMIPNGEKAVHIEGIPGIRARPYHGTRRLLDNEFVMEESGGMGTGYDRLRILAFAPPSRSRVFMDYITL